MDGAYSNVRSVTFLLTTMSGTGFFLDLATLHRFGQMLTFDDENSEELTAENKSIYPTTQLKYLV